MDKDCLFAFCFLLITYFLSHAAHRNSRQISAYLSCRQNTIVRMKKIKKFHFFFLNDIDSHSNVC